MSVNTYINGQLVRVSGSSTQTQSDAIQVAALPTASAQYVGKVYQYIGNDTETEKHGLFYGCIEENSEYKWVQVNTDPDTEIISNEKLAAMWGSSPTPTPTPADPVIKSLTVKGNGTINKIEGLDGYAPVIIDVTPNSRSLYSGNNISISGSNFSVNLNDTLDNYNEIIIHGKFGYNNTIPMWSSKYPASMLNAGVGIGASGSDNYCWLSVNSDKRSLGSQFSSYDSPGDVIGLTGDSNRSETVLFTNTESSNPVTITLSDDIDNYTEICLIGSENVNGIEFTVSSFYPTNLLTFLGNDKVYVYNDYHFIGYTVTDKTTLTFASSTNYVIKKVIGITDPNKTYTSLWKNTGTTNPASITLSDDLTDYMEIILVARDSNGFIGTTYISTDALYNLSQSQYKPGVFTNDLSLMYFLTDETTLTLESASSGFYITDVIGTNRNPEYIIT